MKARFYFIATAMFITVLMSCTSPQKLCEKGDFDDAIALAVKKLQTSKPNAKHIATLEQAFNYINGHDLNKLELMLKNADSASWDNIYALSTRIDRRQQLVTATASRLNLKLDIDDVQKVIIQSKSNAISYWYNKGLRNLEMSKEYKLYARKAFQDFKNVIGYDSNYKDIQFLTNKSIEYGRNHAGYTVINDTRYFLPQEVENELYNVALKNIETNLVAFHNFKTNNSPDKYDYTIVTRINRIISTPNAVNTNNYVESKDIIDGFEFQYDNKGKILKDSTGEPIKFDKIIHAKAMITEVVQNKNVEVLIDVEIYNSEQKLLKSIPLNSNQCFRNIAVTYHGNEKALSNETRCKLGGNPLPFPEDVSMIEKAFSDMKNDISRYIKKNRDIVEF